MRSTFRSLAVALTCVASAVTVFAGDQLFDFDVGGNPPSGDPASVPGFVLYSSSNPSRVGSAYQMFDGNPAAGGYLQLTDAGTSENCGILFPDVDLYTNSLGEVISLPIKAFKITMDVRVGNGNRRPADGFSINFARQSDPALQRALRNPPLFAGWAGGDGSLAAAADRGDGGNPESGVHDGLSVCFDTWAGNWLPANGVITNSTSANDIEGVYIRLDDVTIDANPFGANAATRNGGCYIQTDVNPADPCQYTVLTNTATMQTGPWSGPSANGTADGAASDGTYNLLGWAPLSMEVNEQKQVTVIFKGLALLNKLQLTNYPTSQGRVLLAARTGGNYEHTHIDNVRVVTVPSVQPILRDITGNTNGFVVNIQNVAAAQVTNFALVTLDGTNVTSLTTRSNYLDVTTHGKFELPVPQRFTARSSHSVTIVYQDAIGGQYTNSANFTVPQWVNLPPGIAIPLSQVDTSLPGFKVKSYQGRRIQPNQLRWTEEQVIGLRGPNVADQTGATGGFFTWDGTPRFSNGAGNTLFPGAPTPFTTFGIGNVLGSATDSAMEMFAYLYFPSNGTYVMYIGSDDGFRLSFAANPMDRMGIIAHEFDGGRGLGNPGDMLMINISEPGCYPVRMLWENGHGPDGSNGANLQWFIAEGATTNYTLINDVASPVALLTYRDVLPAASLGAYVKQANPVYDGQNVTFFQPLLVELGNGTGTRTVNVSSINMAVDGTNLTLATSTPAFGTTRVLGQLASFWSVGRHTNVLTFSDNAGTNYTYTYPFTVINVQPTNTITLDVANMVPASSVDSTKRGFRVKTYQSPHDNPNHVSWTEMQLQGLKGPNVADQQGTYGTGYFYFGDVNSGSEGEGVLDFRYATSATGSEGEWTYSTYQSLADNFQSIGNNLFFTGTGFNAYRFNFAANKAESCAMDIGTWLVFPSAGYYIFHVNSDDGSKLIAPAGSPFSKLGVALSEDNQGGGVAGPSGARVGDDRDYSSVYVPAAGAYPFRLVYENGGTDGGIEWSIYKVLPDGSVAKTPINDYLDPNSIRAYQTLTAGDTTAPYVTYANPPHRHQETTFWQPIVVELTDGPGTKTVNASSVQLRVDGFARSVVAANAGAGITRVVENMGGVGRLPGAHTAILTFSDNAGRSYTNTWPFTVMTVTPYQNNQPGVVVDVPVSSMVPIATVDHAQPGFRVYAYQTGTQGVGNIEETERLFRGERGANIVDFTGATNGVYFVHNDVVDFADGYAHVEGITGYDVDSARGRYRYNYSFTNHFGIKPKGSGANDKNDCALIFAGYVEFPQAGLYAMAFNSDDGFKVTVPYGNPRGVAGTMLGWANGGRGIYTGTGFGSQGSDTHFVFNIPAPGAYPIRAIWWNGGGGLDIEWTVYQYMPDGSVVRTIMGDTNTPGALKVYQDSSVSGPWINSLNPGNMQFNLVADDLQVMTADRGADVVISMQDGNAALNPATLSLTIGGVAQPLDYLQPGGGVTTVTRRGTNALPSGLYAPAVFTYQDSGGRSYTNTWTFFSRAFNGTVLGGLPVGSGDEAKRGFLWRSYQVDGNGTTVMPTRLQVAEQVLAGYWTNNFATASSFILTGTGQNGSNGLVNVNQDAPTATGQGNFRTDTGFPEIKIPGIPGTGPSARNTDSIAGEALAYVEFPTNGTYTMGVSSDDGFRVTRGWAAPNNKGALVVSSPSGLAGVKPTTLPSMASCLLINPISGQMALALGTGNGSSNPLEGCLLTNAPSLAGKIALVYRGTCGFVAKVQNAQAAGALAVVIVQDRPVATAAEGWFPTELGVTPIQNIPAVMIQRKDGDALMMALTNNTVIQATLTPMDYLVNPPANSPVLGQADYGKGASDILFNVTVPTAGVYPLRLLWMEGGGGGNCEWFSYVGANRVLVNDTTSVNGPGLKAYYGLATPPTLNLQLSGSSVIVDYTGTLQQAPTVTGPWTDIYDQPPLSMPVSQAASQFFRTR